MFENGIAVIDGTVTSVAGKLTLVQELGMRTMLSSTGCSHLALRVMFCCLLLEDWGLQRPPGID